jgi:hypothetical protein
MAPSQHGSFFPHLLLGCFFPTNPLENLFSVLESWVLACAVIKYMDTTHHKLWACWDWQLDASLITQTVHISIEHMGIPACCIVHINLAQHMCLIVVVPWFCLLLVGGIGSYCGQKWGVGAHVDHVSSCRSAAYVLKFAKQSSLLSATVYTHIET